MIKPEGIRLGGEGPVNDLLTFVQALQYGGYGQSGRDIYITPKGLTALVHESQEGVAFIGFLHTQGILPDVVHMPEGVWITLVLWEEGGL